MIILELKDQIKGKRKELKLSAEELATLIGVSKDNIYKWEKGTRPSNPEDYIKLTNWLNGKMEGVPKLEDRKEPSPMELLAGLTEGFRAIAATMKSIENKMAQESTQAKILKALEDQDTTFAKSIGNQRGLATLVGELLMRDIAREAKNNPENVQKILQDFLRRIGPKLSPDVKESIGADGRN